MKKKRTERASNNLKNIIKMGIKSNIFQTISALSNVPKENLNKELEDFQEDIKNYRSGVFLWLNDSYPNVVLLYNLLGVEFLNKMKILPNMKVVVDEYFTFIADVKTNNYNYNPFKEEMEKSQKAFSTGSIQPKDFLIKKIPFLNYINRRFTEDLQALAPQIQAYAAEVTPKIKPYLESLKEKLDNYKSRENKKHKKNTLIGLFNIMKSIKILKKIFRDPELIMLIEKIKEIQKKTLPSLNDITDDIKDMTEEFKNVYNDNISIAYEQLNSIKSIDSFHLEFTKFIARLFHILINQDRDFSSKKYLEINPKKYYPETRGKLKEFLDSEMKNKYPELSKYLHLMLKYNKYRKLEAHENPIVRITRGIAYFSKFGNHNIRMNLNEITMITRTYSYFIESLRLF